MNCTINRCICKYDVYQAALLFGHACSRTRHECNSEIKYILIFISKIGKKNEIKQVSYSICANNLTVQAHSSLSFFAVMFSSKF